MSRSLWAVLCASVLLLAGCASDAQVSATGLYNARQMGTYQVHGAVIHPGEFNLPGGELLTLRQAINRSGGFKPGNEWDDGGNPDAVRVSRLVHGSVVQYTLYAAPGGRDEDFIIRPGDSIFVPKRTFSSPVPVPLPYAS
jgi:protein involved in polysaccharide export with SLBB domain